MLVMFGLLALVLRFRLVLEFHNCQCSNSPSPVNVKLLDHRVFTAFVICTSTSLVWSHLHGSFLS